LSASLLACESSLTFPIIITVALALASFIRTGIKISSSWSYVIRAVWDTSVHLGDSASVRIEVVVSARGLWTLKRSLVRPGVVAQPPVCVVPVGVVIGEGGCRALGR